MKLAMSMGGFLWAVALLKSVGATRGAYRESESWETCQGMVCNEALRQAQGLARLKLLRNYVVQTMQLMDSLVTSLDMELVETGEGLSMFIGPHCQGAHALLLHINEPNVTADRVNNVGIIDDLNASESQQFPAVSPEREYSGSYGDSSWPTPGEHTDHVGTSGPIDTEIPGRGSHDGTEISDFGGSDSDSLSTTTGGSFKGRHGSRVIGAEDGSHNSFGGQSGSGLEAGSSSGDLGRKDSKSVDSGSSYGGEDSVVHIPDGGLGGKGSGTAWGGSGSATKKPREGFGSTESGGGTSASSYPKTPTGKGVCRAAPTNTAPGMDEWCRNNCALGYCPQTHCTCN